MDKSTKDPEAVAYDEGARIQRRSAKIQLYLIRVRIGFRLLDLCGAIICVISLTDTLVEYYSTQGACAPNNGPCAWLPPTQTMTYPSLVCLGAAYINLILSAIVLIAYIWGTAKADQWESNRGLFEKACTALKITLSSAAAGSMYANQSSSGTVQSLWGQACNPVTQGNQLLTQIVNFDQFCIQQQLAIGMHVAHLVFEGLTGITYALNYWADYEKKKLDTYKATAASAATPASPTNGKGDKYQEIEQVP